MGSAPTKRLKQGNSSDKFVFSYVIGKGGFGEVYSAFHIDSKEWFALKRTNIRHVLTHKNGFKMLMSELTALRRVGRHSCIVGLNAAFHDDRFCYMALDLCTGGDLRYHLKKKERFDEKRIAFIVACIASALRHCHQQGVLHRDVKPENILIDETGFALLTDFGVSYSTDTHLLHPNGDIISHLTSGTRQYLAPEVFTSCHTHGCPSDFWALGVVAFELLYGQRPFSSHCPTEFIQYAQNHLPEADGTFTPPPCCIRRTGKRVAGFVDEGCSLHFPASEGEGGKQAIGMRRVHFPDMSPVNGYVSVSCRRVLKGLLSVNQSRRWGHGEHNYLQLQRAIWFVECDVNWQEVLEGRHVSPFVPDLREVSMDICQTYAGYQLDQEAPSQCSTCGCTRLEASDVQVVESKLTVAERQGVCGHRQRVLDGEGVQEALNEFFFISSEYGEFDPALDDAWLKQSGSRCRSLAHMTESVVGVGKGVGARGDEGGMCVIRQTVECR